MNFATWTKYNVGEFAIWANCGVGEFQFAPTTHANVLMLYPWRLFLFIYTYLHVYLRTSRKHTRRGELQFAHPLRTIRPLLYVNNSLSKPTKKIFLKIKS